MISSYFFIVWASTAGLNIQGVNKGSLGHITENTDVINACMALQSAKKNKLNAHLYEIGGNSSQECDWGCIMPVSVREVECKTEKVKEYDRIIAVPK